MSRMRLEVKIDLGSTWRCPEASPDPIISPSAQYYPNSFLVDQQAIPTQRRQPPTTPSSSPPTVAAGGGNKSLLGTPRGKIAAAGWLGGGSLRGSASAGSPFQRCTRALGSSTRRSVRHIMRKMLGLRYCIPPNCAIESSTFSSPTCSP